MTKFYILIFLVQVLGARASCSYNQVIRGFEGLKLLSIPNGYVIPNNQTSPLITNGANAVLYCEGEFAWYDYYDRLKNKIGEFLTIYCDNNEMQYTSEKYLNKMVFNADGGRYVRCYQNLISAKFYSGKIDYCDYDGLRHGLYIENVPIVSLELCHDFNESEPIFTHYVAARRSKVLAMQIYYNPSNVTGADLGPQAEATFEDEKPPPIILENEYTLFIPSLKPLLSELDYRYSNLTPSPLYQSFNLSSFKYNFGTLNTVPWWTPLRIGNWEVFQKLLSQQVEKESYSIYAGKSHKAFYPNKFVCNSETEMSFNFDGQKKYIPLYIWNYIIPRQKNTGNQEFVLVGINSPFTETQPNNTLVFCEDICDKISWLKPLQATRKMPSFGYMFCCNPKKVYKILEGFPFKIYKNIIEK